jgi:hypothetical protein
MRFDQTVHSDSTVQMALPVFQPLRLWTQKKNSVHKHRSAKQFENYRSGLTREFCMKGGFMNVSGSERRLVIAGKIFRS